MTKVKITCEFEMDFQKYYDEIPEGLYTGKRSKVTNEMVKNYVYQVLHDSHIHQIIKHGDWKFKDEKKHYLYAKHHLEIWQEVAKQIEENAKVIVKHENK